MVKWYGKLNDMFDSMPVDVRNAKDTFYLSRDWQYSIYNTSPARAVKQFTYKPKESDIGPCLPLPYGLSTVDTHQYEVIMVDQPRQFYIDIDLPFDKYQSILKTYPRFPKFEEVTTTEIVKMVISEISKIIKKEFPYLPLVSNPTILQVPNESSKKSAHLIYTDIILKNQQETHDLAQIIKHHLKAIKQDWNRVIFQTVYDMRVYNKTQAFRLPFQSKLVKDSPDYCLIPTDPLAPVEDLIVGIYTADVDNTTKFTFDAPVLHEMAVKYLAKKQKTSIEFTDMNFEIVASLEFANTEMAKPNSVDPTHPVAYLLSKIPNSAKHPQTYHMWVAIGQAIKNISSKKDPSEQENNLQLWIKWSQLAAPTFDDEENECTILWNQMRVRPPGGYHYPFLNTIAKFYCTDVKKYNDNIQLGELFDVSKSNPVFDQVNEYTERYTRPYNMGTDNNTRMPDKNARKGTMGRRAEPGIRKLKKGDCDIIIVEAGMGSGKSFQMMEEIKRNNYRSILVISPRKSFSKEKTAELRRTVCPEIIDYQDPDMVHVQDWTEKRFLAIQVESLHHLKEVIQDDTKCYDLIILDEVESILYQFSSNTHKKLNDSFKTFMILIANSRHAMLMDAFITNRVVKLCKIIKNDMDVDKVIRFDINNFNPNSHITANILGIATAPSHLPKVKQDFMNRIADTMIAGKKACLTCASKEFMDQILKFLENHPQLQFKKNIHYLAYNRDADDQMFQDLANVREIWSNPMVRLVAFTTCITVGINYDVPGVFDTTFVYGSIAGPVARDLMQSHFRVRHLNDPNIYIALNCCKMPGNNNIMTGLNEIFNANERVCRLLSSSVLQGDLALYKKKYNQIAVYNDVEDAIGYRMYSTVFIHLLKQVGYAVVGPPDDVASKNANSLVTAVTAVNAVNAVNAINMDDTILPEIYPIRAVAYMLTKYSLIKAMISRVEKSQASAEDKKNTNAYFFYKSYIDAHRSRIVIKSVVENNISPELYLENRAMISSQHLELEEFLEKIIAEQSRSSTAKYSFKADFAKSMHLRANALEQTLMQTFVSDLYHLTSTDKTSERHLINIIMDMNITDFDQFCEKRVFDGVKSDIMEGIRLKHIRKIYKMLGQSHSFSTNTITDTHLANFKEYYLENIESLKHAFNINVRAKSFKLQQCITLISAIFLDWNGFSLTVTSSKAMELRKKSNTNSTTANSDYKCQLTTTSGLIYIYTQFISDGRIAPSLFRTE